MSEIHYQSHRNNQLSKQQNAFKPNKGNSKGEINSPSSPPKTQLPLLRV